MRKILTSVLSVAGLLAVVLALAASPASAAKDVVQITSAESAGVYTVSWETNGGCDPGAGTSGGTGSITLTVADDETEVKSDPPVPTELTGSTAADFVTINDDCSYVWTGLLVEATTGAQCQIGGLPGALFADTALTVVGAGACAPPGRITVTVTDGSIGEDDEGDATNDGVTGGAIQETTFTVTATPVRNSNAACAAVSGETDLNDQKIPEAKLNVIGDAAIVKNARKTVTCRYNVAVATPAGFAAPGKSNLAPNTSLRDEVVADLDAVPPVVGVTGIDAEQATTANAARSVSFRVATRDIYLVQTVEGDAGGAAASYRLSVNICVADLPAALMARSGSGGIVDLTSVELREGRFDISAAVSETGKLTSAALDHKAVPCNARATVSNLPDHCSSQNPTNVVVSNLRDDADGNGRVLVEFTITCAEPEPEAMPEPEMTEPEMTEPEMTEPEMTEPEVTEPEGPKARRRTPPPADPTLDSKPEGAGQAPAPSPFSNPPLRHPGPPPSSRRRPGSTVQETQPTSPNPLACHLLRHPNPPTVIPAKSLPRT